MAPGERLRQIREELAASFHERAALIDGALVALLSGHHLLVLGPPGTAKSMLADEICRRLDGAMYFQWLLTKFTTPEEVFGAVSLSGLENDEYKRVTALKLPEAHIAFLDEVFKANSSILNAMLTLMNERRFHNGSRIETVPLIALFGASNELPEDDELQALYDRFLLRFSVDYIEEDFRFLKMLQQGAPERRTSLSLADLGQVRDAARALPIPDPILRILADLRRELKRAEIVSSDRRYRQCLDVLRAHAFLCARERVAEDDVFFLEHVLWRTPGERGDVRAIIHRLLRGYEDEARELLYQSRELRDYATRSWESRDLRDRAVVEAHTKIRSIMARLDRILGEANDRGRPLDAVEAVRSEIEDIQKQMLEAL